MPVVLFNHSRIRMAEVSGQHHEGHAVHDGVARVSVPKLVKRDGLGQVGMPRRLDHAAHLVTWAPRLAVFAGRNRISPLSLPEQISRKKSTPSWVRWIERAFPFFDLATKTGFLEPGH